MVDFHQKLLSCYPLGPKRNDPTSLESETAAPRERKNHNSVRTSNEMEEKTKPPSKAKESTSRGEYSNPYYSNPSSYVKRTAPLAISNVDYYENTTSPPLQGTPPQPVYHSLQDDTLNYESMYAVASPGRRAVQVPRVARNLNGRPGHYGNMYMGLQDTNREQHVYKTPHNR